MGAPAKAAGFDFAAFSDTVVNTAWGLPLVVLLVTAGVYFTVAGGFPLRRMRHAFDILRGRYDDPNDPGEISHFEALSSALSATIGMGNIAGVAIAVSQGGAGAVFWMWIAGLVGTATKFFTCSLALLYRKPNSAGVAQGGPMYFIEVGLGSWAKPLAYLFAVCGMVGCLALFQVNQLAELLQESHHVPRWLTGGGSVLFVGAVILGGITRIGKVTAKIVPGMAVLYFLGALAIIVRNITAVPGLLVEIVRRAFSPGAAAGSAAGLTFQKVLITGIKRAAFSNEAGIGTAPMAHGAAKTKEPIREGLIAMLGPLIDTNIVCSMTALVILITGVAGGDKGVEITAQAFSGALPHVGRPLLLIVVVLFAISTMISYAYYSQKCAGYIFGEWVGEKYVYVYLISIPIAALWSTKVVVNLLDTAFAMMAIPTIIGSLLLSGKLRAAARDYFARMAAPPPTT